MVRLPDLSSGRFLNPVNIAAAAVLACGALVTNAATLADYRFTGGTAASIDSHAGTDAGDFQAVSGANEGSAASDIGFGATSNTAFVRGDAVAQPNTASGALNDDDFLSFTISATNAGDAMVLDELIFEGFYLSDNALGDLTSVTVYLQSSVGGFGDGSPVLDSFALTESGGIGDGGPTYSVDLSAFPSLATAEFRFYFAAVGSSGNKVGDTVRLDNVQLTGDIIPEPASLALMGLGGLTVLFRSRRA